MINVEQDHTGLEVDESAAQVLVNIPNGGKVRIYDGGVDPGDTVGQPAITDAWTDITTGYDGGGWNGLGIASHLIADPAVNGLGLVLEVDLNGAEYLGIREMILGDTNGDDFVDAGDAAGLFGNLGTDGTWLDGDANYDAFIDAGDAAVLFGAIGESFDPIFGAPPARKGTVGGRRRQHRRRKHIPQTEPVGEQRSRHRCRRRQPPPCHAPVSLGGPFPRWSARPRPRRRSAGYCSPRDATRNAEKETGGSHPPLATGHSRASLPSTSLPLPPRRRRMRYDALCVWPLT